MGAINKLGGLTSYKYLGARRAPSLFRLCPRGRRNGATLIIVLG
jgi:hypothetical protein